MAGFFVAAILSSLRPDWLVTTAPLQAAAAAGPEQTRGVLGVGRRRSDPLVRSAVQAKVRPGQDRGNDSDSKAQEIERKQAH